MCRLGEGETCGSRDDRGDTEYRAGRASPAPACLAITLEQRRQPPDDVGMCRLEIRLLGRVRLEVEQLHRRQSLLG